MAANASPESADETQEHATLPGRLLEAREVAEILGMRTDYVYELCRRNAIPHLRFGRTLRFRPEAINQWLEESERTPATPR